MKFPRSNILKRRTEIDGLFREGHRLSGSLVNLVWQPAARFQFGVFVRSGSHSAVRRNRVKRLIREAVRANQALLVKPLKIVIIPRKNSSDLQFESIDAEIGQIFKRLHATNV